VHLANLDIHQDYNWQKVMLSSIFMVFDNSYFFRKISNNINIAIFYYYYYYYVVRRKTCKHALSVVRLLSAFVMFLSNSYLQDLYGNRAVVQGTC